MRFRQRLLISSLFLILANPCWATTEFVTTVNKTGEDWSSVATCESNADNVSDITAATVLVFSVSSVNGTVGDGASVTGADSNATATVAHLNAAEGQILLYAISGGPFQDGEQVEVDASNYVVISDTGDDAIYVCEVYSDDGAISMCADDLLGLTQDANNYLKITVVEEDRHNGIWGDGARVSCTTQGYNIGTSGIQSGTIIEWLEFNVSDPGDCSNFANIRTGGGGWVLRNNMFSAVCANDNSMMNIRYADDGAGYILNNVFYISDSDGVRLESFSNPEAIINGNSFTPGIAGEGIDPSDTSNLLHCSNNLCFSAGDCYDTACDSTFQTSGANDTTAPGTSFDSLTCTDEIESCSDPYDIHLLSSSNVVDQGTDLGTTKGVQTDIDGRDRDSEGDTWDIGADEFVAAGGAERRVIIISKDYGEGICYPDDPMIIPQERGKCKFGRKWVKLEEING